MSIGGAALPAGRDGDDGDAARLSGSVSAPWDPAEWEAAWSDPCFDTDPPEPAWIADAHRESTWAALSASTTGPVGRDALTLLAELNAAQLASGARTADRAELHRASARRESHGDQRTGPRVRCDGTSEDAGDVVDGNGCGKRCRPRGAAGEESDTYERSRPHVSRTETARTLLDGIVLAQRVVNHVQAVQQRLIAALSRPGVAVPLADLVDLAGTDLTDTLAVAAGTAASTASGETLPDNTTVNGIMSPLERAAQNRGSAVGAEPAARDRDP